MRRLRQRSRRIAGWWRSTPSTTATAAPRACDEFSARPCGLSAGRGPQDRPAYIAALESIQSGFGHGAFDDLIARRLEETLDLYIDAALQALPQT